MLIACKCLNLVACSQNEKNSMCSENGSHFSAFGINLDELHQNSKIHSECIEFLRQSIGPLIDLSVTVIQSDLIYKVPMEPWCIHYCINCNTITHAEHTTDATYLINSTLLTNNEEINTLKCSKSFSAVFGVLMRNHQNTTDVLDSNNSYGIKIKQNRIKNLTQHLNDRIQREIFETDERIRRYTEHQFALLKSFREKAEHEYQILVNLINQVPEQLKVIDAIDNLTAVNNATSLGAIENTQSLLSFKQQQQISSFDTPPATPDSTPMSIGNSPTFRSQSSVTGGASRRPSTNVNVVGTLDSDCLFEVEGMENYPVSVSNAMSDVEETEDGEDALGELDLAMQIPRSQKKTSLSIARSLPISIASAAEEHRLQSEIFNDVTPEDSSIDIAASIKALAKSVHGDTVFGDLPRPRFSTQI